MSFQLNRHILGFRPIQGLNAAKENGDRTPQSTE